MNLETQMRELAAAVLSASRTLATAPFCRKKPFDSEMFFIPAFPLTFFGFALTEAKLLQ